MRRRLSGFLLLLAVACIVAVTACTTRDAKRNGEADNQRVVWVFFRDSATMNVAGTRQPLSDYELARRRRLGIPVFDNDYALPAALVAKVAATGANVRVQSRWLRAVSVSADARSLRRILAMHEVTGIRDVGTLVRTSADRSDKRTTIASADNNAARGGAATRVPREDSSYYGRNWYAIQQLDIAPSHQLGIDGTGVRIALFDTGFERAHPALQSRSVIAQRDFINNDGEVANEPGDTSSVDQEVHGTEVWSMLGGFRPTEIVGPAYGAQFLLAKVDKEPFDTMADEDRWIAAMEWASSLGAQIINSSVALRFRFSDRATPVPYDSLDGDSFLITRAADEAARRGILVVQAMGEADTPSPGTLSAPADADSVIGVSSSDRFGNALDFQPGFPGRGPTADGRIKPELVAYGIGLTGASSTTQTGYNINLRGTSYSTAFISGGAAMFMQAWPGFNPMAVRRALQLAGSHATKPDNITGWGYPDISAAILFPEGISLNTLDPSDLTGAVTSVAPTFSWTVPQINSRMHPVTYRVEVARDSAFSDVVYTDTVREAQSLAAKAPLPSAPRLFWRVVGTTQLGIRRASIPVTFRVPDWVKLATLAGTEPTFSATTQPELAFIPLEARAAGPFTYDVQILANGTNQIVQNLRGLTSSTVRVPTPLTPNQSYRWRVIVHARTGQVDTVQSVQPFVVSTDDKPPATVLYQNFPNPFPNGDQGGFTTHVWFDLANDGDVKLTVFDTRGVIVKRLIPARGCASVTLPAGIYGRSGQLLSDNQCVHLDWDGTNESGVLVPRGIYVLRLDAAGSPSLSKRIVFAPDR